ncbi:PTS glucose transporter subunit IIA [Neobacillus niacini]|uniref:PTS sugar transporter subunit IIA n=1 Tax=Neobacillus niacini TaxID=86668 RepID=UPI0021CB0450|nr:PTS glucose transporter subunit IIA [Neobacillus niacini]MCM3763899.1 PTS glucose transporter subunit IIA [Neobacillus niacini]
MLKLFKKKTAFVSPVEGKLKQLADVPDEAFASKAMGDGFAIEPLESNIYSPVNGKVEFVFPTKHAVGIKTDDGIEILIHVGIETVSLNGEGFTLNVQEGQVVKQGDLVITADFERIKDKVPATDVIVVFTNGKQCQLLKAGQRVSRTEKDIIKLF